MHQNKKSIQKLYTGLQNLDAEMMLSCYHPEATFEDPIFKLDSKDEIAGMWGMLCNGAREFEMSFKVLEADDKSGSAQIEAYYLFSSTGRKVHNVINANFLFKDGLIIRHHDRFDFYRWCRQALGFSGILLGWSPFLQKKVQQQARKNLEGYRSKSISK